MMRDHVHMMISIPPKYAVSQVFGFRWAVQSTSKIDTAEVIDYSHTTVTQFSWAL